MIEPCWIIQYIYAVEVLSILIVYMICCSEFQPWLLIVTSVMHEQTMLTQSAAPGSVISRSDFSQ